ncbi:MAG: hypothetical protein ACRBFS_14625 [Aureispira sp.]
MSEEEKNEKSVFSVIAKFYLLIIVILVGVPAYAILGALLLHNYVLCSLFSLAIVYYIISYGEYIFYIIDSIRKWILSGFSDLGEDKTVLDYSLKKRTKIISILLLANLLMLLLRFLLSQDYAIHQFTYFPLRVLALQSIAVAIAYQFDRFTNNIF